ncbi:MAG: ABC transporter permease [Vulcanimicrobiaceae bacterium]
MSPGGSELGIVFATELVRKLRSRIFWLATIAGTLAIAFIIEAPLFFSGVATSSTNDVVLAGPAPLRASATALIRARRDFTIVASVAALPQPVTVRYLDDHRHAGAAIALAVRGGRLHVDVYPRDLSAFAGAQFRDLAPLAVSLQTGLSPDRVARASAVATGLHAIDSKFVDSGAATIAHAVAFGLVLMLYLAIILASQSVMAAVAEEKTSRIAEILVATIEPANLLAGKTFAAAAIALVQIGLWIVTAAALVPHVAASLAKIPGGRATPGGTDATAILRAIDPLEIVAFLAFFVLGYLQYATIYAAAASLISRTEDLASVTTPVLMPVVGAFFVAQYALLQPDSPLVVVCGFVPLLSPFVMFTRIAISSVPWWQTALALGIDVVTVLVCFWAAGRVYRIGMLLYGKLPSLAQIWAALRA